MDRCLLVGVRQHECLEPGSNPRSALGKVLPDAMVSGDHDPHVIVSAELPDPVDVLGVVGKAVIGQEAHMVRLVTIGPNEGDKASREDGRCAIIEKDLHAAASCCSKATAR